MAPTACQHLVLRNARGVVPGPPFPHTSTVFTYCLAETGVVIATADCGRQSAKPFIVTTTLRGRNNPTLQMEKLRHRVVEVTCKRSQLVSGEKGLRACFLPQLTCPQAWSSRCLQIVVPLCSRQQGSLPASPPPPTPLPLNLILGKKIFFLT